MNILNFFDDEIMSLFHLTDEQYDELCENATDEELKKITNFSPTFTEKKEVVRILNKYRK